MCAAKAIEPVRASVRVIGALAWGTWTHPRLVSDGHWGTAAARALAPSGPIGLPSKLR